jgi:hypothetical protein
VHEFVVTDVSIHRRRRLTDAHHRAFEMQV